MMMNSNCISRCISDVQTPIRPTYRNLYKWPESDAEFMRSVSRNSDSSAHNRVTESISCRQMYLRSYTFSTRKETMQEKITRKCFSKSKEGKANDPRKKMRMNQLSCGAVLSLFRRMLACGSASVHS